VNSGLSFVLAILWWLAFSSALALAVGRTIHDADRRAHHDLRSIERYDRGRNALRKAP
jgi:hypothetical protein